MSAPISTHIVREKYIESYMLVAENGWYVSVSFEEFVVVGVGQKYAAPWAQAKIVKPAANNPF